MRGFVKIAIICFGLHAISCDVGAQPIAEIDNQLARYLKKIKYWYNYDYRDASVDKYDSLDRANSLLTAYLIRVGSKVPATVSAKFPKAIGEGLGVVTSEDQKLRLYSWDSYLGGTMVDYENVAQFNVAGKVRCVDIKDTTDDADYGTDYRDIVTMSTKGNKTIYLVFGYNKVSTKDRAESVTSYIIEQGALKKYNFFRTKTKELNSIGYGYDIFASSDKLKSDFDKLPSIHLSKDKHQLFIPVVAGPVGETLTNKFLIYEFDGDKFVYSRVGS